MTLARRSATLVACLVGTTLAACNDPSGPGGGAPLTTLPRALSGAERQTLEASNEFSLALLRAVNARKARQNVVISPFSASVALGMTMNGAAGETLDAMQRTLGVSGRTLQEVNESYRGLTQLLLSLDRSVELRSANSIWYRNTIPFEPAFLTTSRTMFDAEVRAADFANTTATLQAINGWAREKTNGRIEKVLQEIKPDEVMFLLNALYFKGAWQTQFSAQRTQPAPFTRADGSTSTVQMMSREKAKLRVGASAGVTVGELPYGRGAFAMTILLPATGGSVDDLVASLTPQRWDELLATLAEREMDLYLPRFRLTYEDEWNDVLTALGMGVAFDEQLADFSRLSPLGRDMYISFVKQNVFIDVNEQGTEAAAVTTVGIGLTSLPPSFRVDRPFVFAIRERLSGAILFVGKVASLPGA
jgi:serpin B